MTFYLKFVEVEIYNLSEAVMCLTFMDLGAEKMILNADEANNKSLS